MTKKDLTSIRGMKLKIESLQERRERIRSALEGTAVQLREAPSRGTKEHDPMSAQIAQLLEIEERLRDREIAREIRLEEIEKAIDGLPSPESEVMHLRYIVGLKWWQVAQRMNYDERWCKRLAKRAENTLFE